MGPIRRKILKKRFTTEPVCRERIFEVSYRSIKSKKDSAGLRPFSVVNHQKTPKILPLDRGSVINLFLSLLS